MSAVRSEERLVRVCEVAWMKILATFSGDVDGWRHRIETFFLKHDTDHDGLIDIKEIDSMLQSLDIHMNPEELKAFLDDVDSNGNGVVSLEEFIDMAELRSHFMGGQVESSPPVRDSRAEKEHSRALAEESAKRAAHSRHAWEAIVAVARSANENWRETMTELFDQFDDDGKDATYCRLNLIVLIVFFFVCVNLVLEGSGAVDVSEMARGLRSLGLQMNPDQLQAFRDDLDIDQSGDVSVSEWIMAVKERMSAMRTLNFNDEIVDPIEAATNEAWENIISVKM